MPWRLKHGGNKKAGENNTQPNFPDVAYLPGLIRGKWVNNCPSCATVLSHFVSGGKSCKQVGAAWPPPAPPPHPNMAWIQWKNRPILLERPKLLCALTRHTRRRLLSLWPKSKTAARTLTNLTKGICSKKNTTSICSAKRQICRMICFIRQSISPQ